MIPFFKLSLLAGTALASAIPSLQSPPLESRALTYAADILLAIAPTSGTCTGAPAAGECSTNVQAAPFLIAAMSKYEIYNPNEIAAVLSVMAYESGDFKYNTEHAVVRPGQGTRAMMMPPNVLLYVKSIPELASKVTATSTSAMTDANLTAMLALVLPDQYTWGSGPWYLTTQCASTVRPALQAGGQTGFNAYMACLGVDATAARLAYWTRATSAFGLS